MRSCSQRSINVRYLLTYLLKCKVLCITLNKKNVICADYTIQCQPLHLVSSAKYLGVTIDSKLTFNEHINNVTHKANSTRALLLVTRENA